MIRSPKTFVAFISLLCCLFGCDSDQQQERKSDKKITQPTQPTPATKKPIISDVITIAAVGDIMLGTSYPNNSTLPPDGAVNSFQYVRKHLQNADLTFGNLEGTLLDGGQPAAYKLHLKSKAYLFRMPTSYGSVLKDAGFDIISIANNHIGDFGEKGRESTVKTLDNSGIRYAGLLEYPTTEFTIKGVKYGFCAFAPNSNTVPLLDIKGAGQIIANLKQRCDVVIVSFHGGAEGVQFEHVAKASESYFGERRGDLRAFAHNAIDSGADVILGHGPHVSRAMEIYKNRLIAYSLGNFCTYRSVSIAGVTGIAPLLKVNINRKGEFLSGNIISVKQSREKRVEPDTAHRAAKRIKMLSATDFPDNSLDISPTGVLSKADQN
ncbi:CapA family protein [Mucilaginibacter auburnensis]|uniref:Poly-gamma-glutamate capsule biosynthesis protein CapA/YwtB (Metallophosphatase superfamily) n=1 Tax=Mucilaginibacter auburnensis TaxID=1457233 RepID=A0A2H9VPI7_9SPHI|nr:CapA family protein [Mucilaginibacter auburnensis]PJJ80222.1 poly-gamma-glutamate capsule biosynthesis protein CapA/YwtB (metallophosphatase superfamily) [Mucilaginibacter auburnensis]